MRRGGRRETVGTEAAGADLVGESGHSWEIPAGWTGGKLGLYGPHFGRVFRPNLGPDAPTVWNPGIRISGFLDSSERVEKTWKNRPI
jgi:hypothetical protein